MKSKAATGRKAKKDSPGKIQAELDRLNLLFQKGRITEEYYDNQYEILSGKLERQKEADNGRELEAYSRLQRSFNGNWLEIYSQLDSAHKNAFWKKPAR